MNIDNIQCSKGRITTLCKTIINRKKLKDENKQYRHPVENKRSQIENTFLQNMSITMCYEYLNSFYSM
jgi:hypothetical protein